MFRELLGSGTHPCTRRVMYPPPREQTLLPSRPYPVCISSSESFIICFNKPVHVSVSLNPVTYSSKLIEPKQGVGQKHRWQPGVVTGVWSVSGGGGGSPKGLSPQPVGADAVSGKMTSALAWTVGRPGGVTENCLVLRKPVTRLVIRILFCVSSKGSAQERNTARKEKLLQKEEKCGFSSLYDDAVQHHRTRLLIEHLDFIMAKIPQTDNSVCFHVYVAVWLRNGEKSAWKVCVQEITCRKWVTLQTLDGTVDNGDF